jgi:hypothetical protein
VWARSRVVTSVRARVAFVLVSKMYRQMYANTGIATDSARVARSTRWAKWLGLAVRRLFLAPPWPDLAMPEGIAPPFTSPATLISLSSLRGEAKPPDNH